MHRVVTVLSPGVNPFDLAISCEVFGLRRPELGVEWYDHRLAGVVRPVLVNGGWTLDPPFGLEALDDADTVIVPACPHQPPRAMIDGLRSAYDRGARMVSFCGVRSRSRPLASWTGGQRPPTGWTQRNSPPDIRECGWNQMSCTSTRVVLPRRHRERDRPRPAHRPSGLRTRYRQPGRPAHGDRGTPGRWAITVRVHPRAGAIVRQRTVTGHGLDVRASRRTCDRPPARATRRDEPADVRPTVRRGPTGTTPMRWLTHQRILRAQDLLEATTLPVEVIASRVGLPRTGTAVPNPDKSATASSAVPRHATTPTSAYRQPVQGRGHRT